VGREVSDRGKNYSKNWEYDKKDESSQPAWVLAGIYQPGKWPSQSTPTTFCLVAIFKVESKELSGWNWKWNWIVAS